MIHWQTVSGCIALLLIAVLWRDISRRRRRKLPPGPRPLPVLGNVFSIPRRDMGAGFRELSKKHGEQGREASFQRHVLTTLSTAVS